ncbi:hypothetical protein GPJ56_006312 [Histomonas meleagridis]|nr:hypothetical protein GPJ56_006312 [Histomonas meleagridis]
MEDFDSKEISNAFNKYIESENHVLSRKNVIDFLGDTKMDKDLIERLFAYLTFLDIIPETQIEASQKLQSLYNDYQEIIKTYLKPVDPENKAKVREIHTINIDIDRSIQWFYEFTSNEFGLTSDQTKNVDEQSRRILTLISATHSSLSYIQGFDRYVLLTYFLSLNFTIKYNLPDTVAECFSYYLSSSLLLISNPSTLLDKDQMKITQQFDFLNKQIYEYIPTKGKILKNEHISSLYFALRWKLLIFADEHQKMSEVFLLWDNFILHKDEHPEYINCLCISHLAQVPIEDPQTVVQTIQQFRDWNTPQIVTDGNGILQTNKIRKTMRNTVLAFCLIAAIVLTQRVPKYEKICGILTIIYLLWLLFIGNW